MASVVPLRTVFERRRKRQDRERIETLTRRVSLRAPGFDRMRQQMRRTRSRSYSAGGPIR